VTLVVSMSSKSIGMHPDIQTGMLSGSAYFCLFAIRGMTRCISWAGCRPKGYDA
jgi:hypothetical protein